MKFEMMVIDGNQLFDTCKRFLIMDLESIEKMHGTGCSDEHIKEALGICCNHASNLYVCGLIDEEFFRFFLDGIIVNDAIDDIIDCMNEIRKDVVKSPVKENFLKNLDTRCSMCYTIDRG